MIASLEGLVEANFGREIVLNVNGIGYLVQILKQTSSKLTKGKSARLWTAQVFREDAQFLFGFEQLEEQRLFDILRSVAGVGPKTAMAVLDDHSPAEIAIAVAAEDFSVFSSVSGIGPKTAKLIVVSLSGKLSAIAIPNHQTASVEGASILQDVTAALVGLGWAVNAAADAVSAVLKTTGGSASTSEVLKLAITKLGAK